MIVARVLPNVTGLDKQFDYLVPERFAALVAIGTIVRVPLHGRRVGGWVTALDEPQVDPAALKELTGVTGAGPSADLIALAEWAGVRWAARRRHFLVAASPARSVQYVPAGQRTGRVVEPRSGATTSMLTTGGGVLRLPPTADPLPCVYSAAALGPALVVVPGLDQVLLMGARLRRAGLTVAVVPDEWAAASGGVDIVIGTRTAAWAPCPGIAAAVVIDEHDEALQSESSPTWHARDVVVERCRRADVPVVVVSPCPTVSALHWRPAVRPPVSREREGWPIVDVVDRSDQEPWRRSLLTSTLIGHLRDHGRRVVCVINTTGRARLLACRKCRALARCERCAGAVAQVDTSGLVCGRCGASRPAVCLECGSSAFANLRPGVTRLGEELTAAAGRTAVTVTGADSAPPPAASLYVGTEAVLHRVTAADVVAFLDFDREILAPRYRAGERAMALLVRAARLVGPRKRGGRIVVQTLLPGHEVIRAAQLADPGRLAEHEALSRRTFGLPPYCALAAVSGAGSDEFVTGLHGVEVSGGDAHYLVRTDEWMALGTALLDAERPRGSRLRIAVDPPDV
ncbi:MAG TPA: hypothetical protein VFV63_01770 [Ilumatobacteraceae bacterium]|nr:hypothetical protein [Ilumatobacteraceae bacterium]